MYYIFGSVQAIPTYRVYQLYDNSMIAVDNSRWLTIDDLRYPVARIIVYKQS
jgi:hypothetical protein